MEWSALVSLFGTFLGVTSRAPQIYRVVQRRSAADISGRALLMNITANLCFGLYALDNEQWPILVNNLCVIGLDGALYGLRRHYGAMKKVSSEQDLSKWSTTTQT